MGPGPNLHTGRLAFQALAALAPASLQALDFDLAVTADKELRCRGLFSRAQSSSLCQDQQSTMDLDPAVAVDKELGCRGLSSWAQSPSLSGLTD